MVVGWEDLFIQDHDSCFAGWRRQMVDKSIGYHPEVAYCGSQVDKFVGKPLGSKLLYLYTTTGPIHKLYPKWNTGAVPQSRWLQFSYSFTLLSQFLTILHRAYPIIFESHLIWPLSRVGILSLIVIVANYLVALVHAGTYWYCMKWAAVRINFMDANIAWDWFQILWTPTRYIVY